MRLLTDFSMRLREIVLLSKKTTQANPFLLPFERGQLQNQGVDSLEGKWISFRVNPLETNSFFQSRPFLSYTPDKEIPDLTLG